MKNTETGEFELVLGNRQVLSVFFIVVILFGVFFAMGYIVGRNSAPSPRQSADNLPRPPVPVESQAETRPARAADAAESPQPPAEGVKPVEGTQPARDLPEPANTARQGAPAEAEERGPGLSGTYLQVSASEPSAAGVLAESLRKKGLPVVTSPAPGKDLIRVLVGPFHDTATLGKAKMVLENARFHPFVLRMKPE